MVRSLPPSVDDLLPRDRVPLRARAWDGLWAVANFVRYHRRLPFHPGRFNDRMVWIRLSGALADPLRRAVTDKRKMKAFVAAVAGSEVVVPTLAELTTPAEIAAYRFPASGVVKPGHASQEVVFLSADTPAPRDRIRSWLELDYHAQWGETHYRGLERSVLVEPLVFGQRDPIDYKLHCLGGRVGLVHVDRDRFGALHRNFLDREFRDIGVGSRFPRQEPPPRAPDNFPEMRALAERLAGYFDGYVRVDLYSDGRAIRVGELTACTWNGLEPFDGMRGESLAWAHLAGRAAG